MKQLACAVLVMGAAGLAACGGGGDDDDVSIVDSGPPPEDAAVAMQCNPVTQTGCDENEKCAQLIISAGPPFLGRTDCVPNGDVPMGEECTIGTPGETTGFDNCASSADQGAQCINGLCREICSAPEDTCSGDGFSCTFFFDLFDDVDEAQVGVCGETCDPVSQDCSLTGEGCYLNPTNREGVATCVGAPDAAPTQGQECLGPDAESCYLNGCAVGYHPQVRVYTVQPTKSPCIAYCRPVDTYIEDPMGTGDLELPLVGRALGFDDEDMGTPPTDCSPERIGAIDHQCRFFQAIGFSDLEFDYIPAEYGFCTSIADGEASLELWGNCELNSEERIVRIFDMAGGGQAGQDAVEMFCNEDPDGLAGACAIGCISDAKAEELFDAYCAAPPVPDSPFCTQPAARARYVAHRRERERRAMESLLAR
jgi:hypothetical protein